MGSHHNSGLATWWFPKVRGAFLPVPIIYLGVYIGVLGELPRTPKHAITKRTPQSGQVGLYPSLVKRSLTVCLPVRFGVYGTF